MNRKVKEIGGKTAFWLTWPLLYVYLTASKRSRILVVVGDKVLVVRGWLSSGTWNVPGGGLKLREAAILGAVRELQEETGIETLPQQLQFLFSRRSRSEQGLKYTMFAYLLELDKKPKIALEAKELIDMQWVDWRKLRDDPKTSQNVKDMIRAWQHAKGEDLPTPAPTHDL